MEVGQDGVAIITLANPPVNALHPHGMHLYIPIYTTSSYAGLLWPALCLIRLYKLHSESWNRGDYR